MGRRLRNATAGLTAFILGSVGTVGIGGSIAMAAPAGGNSHAARLVMTAKITPSVPSDPAIFGSSAGGIPWTIAAGHVRLGANGDLQLNVARLIDPQSGLNPVPYLAASVYCDGMKVATTAAVGFSAQGNAHLHATTPPLAECSVPAVLVNPATAPDHILSDVYIGFTGD